MKKLVMLLATAFLPLSAKAQSVNLGLSYTAEPIGQAQQVAGVLYGMDSTLTYTPQVARQLQADTAGRLLVVSTGSSGGAAQAVSVISSVPDSLTYGYLTTTAVGTAGRGGSYTAVALTSAYSMNITFAAGVNAPCIVSIYPGNGVNASFYWNSMPAWLAPNTIVSVSTTPLVFTAGIGDFLNLSVTGAALSVTAQVRYAPIY